MTGVLYPFPKQRRVVLPPKDATPVGRERHVEVFPGDDGWVVYESDNGGGSCLASGVTKRAAIDVGLDFVNRWNATMTISNKGWT